MSVCVCREDRPCSPKKEVIKKSVRTVDGMKTRTDEAAE